jgi:hypothetical protein
MSAAFKQGNVQALACGCHCADHTAGGAAINDYVKMPDDWIIKHDNQVFKARVAR